MNSCLHCENDSHCLVKLRGDELIKAIVRVSDAVISFRVHEMVAEKCKYFKKCED